MRAIDPASMGAEGLAQVRSRRPRQRRPHFERLRLRYQDPGIDGHHARSPHSGLLHLAHRHHCRFRLCASHRRRRLSRHPLHFQCWLDPPPSRRLERSKIEEGARQVGPNGLRGGFGHSDRRIAVRCFPFSVARERTVLTFSSTRERDVLHIYTQMLEAPYRDAVKTALWSNALYGLSTSTSMFGMALLFWFGSNQMIEASLAPSDFFTALCVPASSHECTI